MNIEIRKVDESDFEQIVELFKEFAEFEKTPEKMYNSVERMKAEKEFFNCFVAVCNGGIIGYVSWFICYYTWTGKAMYMDDLYVQPAFRGKGIGKQLLNKVLTLAKETGCHKMHWQVSSWNKSTIGFYKSLGAVIDKTEQNCDLILIDK